MNQQSKAPTSVIDRPDPVDELEPARLGCVPGTSRGVIDALRAQGNITIVPPRPAQSVWHRLVFDAPRVPEPTLPERLAAVGLVYARRGTAVAL